MAIKIAIALELPDDDSRDALLRGLRLLLIQQRKAPKYKVKVSYEVENEEIGDDFPLDLGALGVPFDADVDLREAEAKPPTPMERYLNTLEGGES
jgi:hypothetical protein